MVSDHRFDEWLPEGLKGGELHEPSPGGLRRAIALGVNLGRPTPRWLALLLFDSGAGPIAAGVRHKAGGDRRLLYQIQASGSEAPGHQLDLQLRLGTDDQVELTGQLLPALPDSVVHAESGRRRQSQPLGLSGEFLLRRMGSGNQPITLRIETADETVIVLPDLRIESQETDRS